MFQPIIVLISVSYSVRKCGFRGLLLLLKLSLIRFWKPGGEATRKVVLAIVVLSKHTHIAVVATCLLYDNDGHYLLRRQSYQNRPKIPCRLLTVWFSTSIILAKFDSRLSLRSPHFVETGARQSIPEFHLISTRVHNRPRERKKIVIREALL